MTHVTPTDMHMLYDGLLTEDQSVRVNEHICGCAECRTQFELMSETLADLQSHRIKQMSGRQFQKMWGEITAVEGILRPADAKPEQAKADYSLFPAFLGSQPLYATASGTAEQIVQIPGTFAVAVLETIDGLRDARAYWEILDGELDQLVVRVRIPDNADDLEGMQLRMECYNNYDVMPFHPKRLVKVQESWGEGVYADMELEDKPHVLITKEQFRDLSVHIKVVCT